MTTKPVPALGGLLPLLRSVGSVETQAHLPWGVLVAHVCVALSTAGVISTSCAIMVGPAVSFKAHVGTVWSPEQVEWWDFGKWLDHGVSILINGLIHSFVNR